MERLYETLRVKLIGIPPGLIMDNGDRADPRDPIAIEKARLGSVKAKDRTEKQLDLMEDLDYIGGLWTTESGKIAIENDQLMVEGFGNVCIIGGAVERMLLDSCKMLRVGTKALTAFMIEGPYCLNINGEHPITAEELFERRDEFYIRRRVRAGMGTKKSWVIANRPRFIQWNAIIDINYFPSSLNERKVIEVIETAGVYKGLGSYRPKYGRFDVEILSNRKDKRK